MCARRASCRRPSDNYLLRLGHAGAPDDWVSPEALPSAFALERVGRAPAHFDEVQLQHWQREAVKRLTPPELDAWLAPALPSSLGPGERRLLGATVSHNILFPGDARYWVGVLFDGLPPLEAGPRGILADAGPGFFAAGLEALAAVGQDLPALARELRERTGRTGARLFMPLRIALTGRGDGRSWTLPTSRRRLQPRRRDKLRGRCRHGPCDEHLSELRVRAPLAG